MKVGVTTENCYSRAISVRLGKPYVLFDYSAYSTMLCHLESYVPTNEIEGDWMLLLPVVIMYSEL
jgi:hypothetical protein